MNKPVVRRSLVFLCIMYSVASFAPRITRHMAGRSTRTGRFSAMAAATVSAADGTTEEADGAKQRRPKQEKQRRTGGLRGLPVVRPPNEVANRARKQVAWTKADVNIANARTRARKHGAETLNALIQSLCLPLRDTIKGYKFTWRELHPFERVVADLTVASRQQKDGLTLSLVLEDINEARKMVRDTGKDWIAKCKTVETARQSDETLKEGMEALLDVFENHVAPPLSNLVELQKSLRNAPIVALDTPAVVLVGSPNVGKSSIVRAISSATPEVNNYPFTTRGMTLGHVEVFWTDNASIVKAIVPDARARQPSKKNNDDSYAFSQLCQVMDSPGVLVRDSDDDRNEMELLTLAAMQHLPTAVLYVMDFSGGAGDNCSSIKDQLILRRQIRARFPKRPWVDVVSKYDLPLEDETALDELQEILRQEQHAAPFIKLSIHDGIGVDELRDEILRMLGEVRVVLDAMAAVEEE